MVKARSTGTEAEVERTVIYAPVDVLFPKGPIGDEDEVDTVLVPDLFVVCDRSKIAEKGVLGAPDLVIEILSPSTAVHDMVRKHRAYERNGVREYWVVDPANRVLHQFVLCDGAFADAASWIHDAKKPPEFESAIFGGPRVGLSSVFTGDTTPAP